MENKFNIRPIILADAQATLEIYRPYVEKTIISFEYDSPAIEEWETRIKNITAEYPWLVCEYNNQVIGYAYASKHRYRTAYSWAVESTIYFSEKFHHKGIAWILYEALFEMLWLQGFVNVYAGVTVPNVKSEKFHLSLAFYDVGYFKKIGFKFGEWHDTRWLQRHLADHPANPAKPKIFSEIIDTPAFNKVLETANERLDAASRSDHDAQQH